MPSHTTQTRLHNDSAHWLDIPSDDFKRLKALINLNVIQIANYFSFTCVSHYVVLYAMASFCLANVIRSSFVFDIKLIL